MASSTFASLLLKLLRAWDTLRTWARSTALHFARRSPKEGKDGRGGVIHQHPTTASSGAAATASSSRAV